MSNNKLKHLWDVQLEFNNKFFVSKIGKNVDELSMEEKVFWSKNHLLCIVSEAMEVLNEVPQWKEHRNTVSNFIPSNLYEEIIDVNKFSLGLAQIWGMTFEQYYEEYLRKSYVVEQRWHQEHDLKLIDKDSKIVGIDIDGVLGEYEKCFLNYFNECHDSTKFNSIEELKDCIGIEMYEKIKSEYRQSGYKADMQACEGASEFTKKLREMGYKIIILTARPYKEYYTIYPDTLKFLEKREIIFDAIIFDENKHMKIIKEFPTMEFMIEDNTHIAKSIANQGYKVFLKNCNLKNLNETKNIQPFKTLLDILNYLPI